MYMYRIAGEKKNRSEKDKGLMTLLEKSSRGRMCLIWQREQMLQA